MKAFKFILFFLICPAVVLGQQMITDSSHSGTFGFIPKKVDYHLSIGTQFSTSSGYGSGLSSFITPSINYTINKRLRIGGGISIVNTTLFNFKPYYPVENSPAYNENFNTATVFVNGQYLLSDRLTIYGCAFKQFLLSGNPLPYSLYNPFSRDGAQGIQMNVDYRIGKNFHIQAGFGYSKGTNIYSDPFGNFISPSPFGSPYRW